jgi:ubiquinone/menaquinone biosynthesis C-methylase UbiE
MKADQYDRLAEVYEQQTKQSAYNMFCERPATLSLIGDLQGKAVLDAACGTGFYAAYCEQHGASKVLAFDGSPNMVELARLNLTRATVFVHDLGMPLTTIPAKTLDGIICALALEYIQDIDRCLQEFFRVLKPGGFLVFSIENPWLVYQSFGNHYWDQELITHESSFLKGVQGYRRPLAMYTNGLNDNGFLFEQIVEAQPVERCRELFPEIYQKMMKIPFFLAVRAYKAK